jgi:hypothetical protein
MQTHRVLEICRHCPGITFTVIVATAVALTGTIAGAQTTCSGGSISQGNGEDLHVTGPCTVKASLAPYKYGDVNIYGTGASLTFLDPGTNETTDFWASSILVESGASLIAGTSGVPYGEKGAVLTIHIYGAGESRKGLSGITCVLGPHCGVPDAIWNSNGNTIFTNLPGGVHDRFYAYQPITYDDGNPDGYFGYKVLAVSYNGTLSLYGAKGAVADPQVPSYSGTSWVRLNANAPATSNQLVLDRLVDWQKNDEIVISTTDYMADHSEKRQIEKVDPSADDTHSIVTLTQPLTYPHHGQKYSLTSLPAGVGPDPDPNNVANPTKSADVRAAVGLLNRSIVIKSAGDTAGKDLADDSYFGAHTVFRQGFLSIHIQGVEFSLMGQGGRIMHYPVHFHMARKTPTDTVIEDCTVNESMTRWYVIHGTQGVTLARNVGYNSIGHGYYFEDGTETDNKLYANLGVFARAAVKDGNNTRQVPGILAAPYPAWNAPDAQEHIPFHTDIDHPTLFWIMNGWNDIKYNMAVGAGSCGACYWLVTGANSTISRDEIWDSYAAEQSGKSPGDTSRAGMSPLMSFVGNTCSSAPSSFNTISDGPVCHGVVNENPVVNLPKMTPVPNPFGIPNIGDANQWDYYPTVDRGGGRFATMCPAGKDCGDNSQVPRCDSGDPNCMITLLDHYTTSFNYTETNFAAVWLRPQWYLFLNSIIADVQNGGMTFVTGGGYTASDAIQGHWALAKKSAFIGSAQTAGENNFASTAGPFNPKTGLTCAKKSDGAPAGLFCLDQPDGMLMVLNNFGMNQRFFNIYDGPAFEESNAYLDIQPTTITGCDINNNVCSDSPFMYGQVLGLPMDKNKQCYMPNAAIAWKQPNGFYYPPAFHSDNLYFNNVAIRHYVIEPLFAQNPAYLFQTDANAMKTKYCVGNPAMFDNFTDIDRQTELNDDNGSLTGLVDTISVNEDSFFSAPLEDFECESDISTAVPPATAKTSPYDYVSTVMYSDHGVGAGGIWDTTCSNNVCFGVPLHRLDLLQAEVDNKLGPIPPRILMMGQSVDQRSTLSVNHGNFYIDTTQS